MFGTCAAAALQPTVHESVILAPATHVVPNDALDFLVLDEMAGTVQDEVQLASQVVLLEDLLVWHVEFHLELHQQRAEELRVAPEEDLPAQRAFLQHLAVLALGHLDRERPAGRCDGQKLARSMVGESS